MTRIRRFYERIIWRILSWNTGQEIPEFELRSLWEILREILKKQGYKVDEISMPLVKGRVLEPGEYARVGRIVDRLPNTRMNTINEYGQYYSTESAIATLVRPPGSENEYLIFLCKSRCDGSRSMSQEMAHRQLSIYICHELAHIWEHLLDVKPAGLLTKQILGEDLSKSLAEKGTFKLNVETERRV